MGPKFFQTIIGQRFFEGTVPALVKNLGRIATALEKNLEQQEAAAPAMQVSIEQIGDAATKLKEMNDSDHLWTIREFQKTSALDSTHTVREYKLTVYLGEVLAMLDQERKKT